MRLSTVTRPMLARAAVSLVTATITAVVAAGASAHYSFGDYTYKYRTTDGCRHHVDPVNVMFYGSHGYAHASKRNVIRHMSWRNQEGSGQYFATHGICYHMDFEQASAGSKDDRFHIRAKQGKDRDRKGRYNTAGAVHHEDIRYTSGCGLISGGHAVDSNGSNGSGFDQGRVELKRRMERKGHAAKYVRKNNKKKFRQCDGDWASSNGLVAWIQVTHLYHGL